MSDAPVHLIHGRLLTVLCGAEEIKAAIIWFVDADIGSADCETCIKRVPRALKREEERAAVMARKPAARPLRDGETLGRAGRDLGHTENGAKIHVERARDMTPVDRRRVAMSAGAGYEEQMVELAERPPLVDEDTGETLPVIGWEQGDDSRGLQHLDGNAEVRPSKDWEDNNSGERQVEHYFDRLAMNADLHAARKAKPLHQQLRDLEHEFVKLQTQQARRIAENDAAARPGAAGGDSTPQGDEYAVAFLDSRGVNSRFVQIRWHIDALWEAIDAHHGRGVKDYSMMDKAEKDAILTGPELRNVTPEEIHALHPALGAAVTVERVRRGAGQDRLGNLRAPREAVVRTKWTDEDDRLVLHSTVPDSELTTRLGRTADAIRLRRKRLGEKATA